MSCFLSNSSLGKKLVMSVTGMFLVLFILFHMSMNITAIISPEAYNMICELLGANWYALAGTAVLALGVFVHFLYAVILTLNNYKARGSQRYAVTVQEPGVAWASKNMLVLGFIILGGLLIHLFNFWSKMQLVEIMGGHVNSLGYSPADGAALSPPPRTQQQPDKDRRAQGRRHHANRQLCGGKRQPGNDIRPQQGACPGQHTGREQHPVIAQAA